MSDVIDYDQPVVDLIAGLDATGHVTHETFTKKYITVHHNGANLTHEGVLSVWKTRRASAHFDVDSKGRVAQYVRLREYAWATGSTVGNELSISIEQANSSFAPHWEVAEATWKATARLIGWLCYHELKARPSASNVLPHRHWSATDCPGPFVLAHLNAIIVEAQKHYDDIKAGNKDHQDPAPPHKKTIHEVAQEVVAGKWGNGPDRTHKLLVAGYDPNAVQVEVNRILRGTNKPHLLTINEVAKEVIAGKWGNGVDRIGHLQRAGYDSNAVQAEVNRLLR
jgi:hypothetical protein